MQEGVVACGMVRLNVVYDQHGLMCDRDKMIPAVPMAELTLAATHVMIQEWAHTPIKQSTSNILPEASFDCAWAYLVRVACACLRCHVAGRHLHQRLTQSPPPLPGGSWKRRHLRGGRGGRGSQMGKAGCKPLLQQQLATPASAAAARL
jgi:hypothetical protein